MIFLWRTVPEFVKRIYLPYRKGFFQITQQEAKK